MINVVSSEDQLQLLHERTNRTSRRLKREIEKLVKLEDQLESLIDYISKNKLESVNIINCGFVYKNYVEVVFQYHGTQMLISMEDGKLILKVCHSDIMTTFQKGYSLENVFHSADECLKLLQK